MQKTNSRVYIEIKLKGFINDHFQECTNTECVCSHIEEIYDPGNDKYLKLKIFGLDRNSIRAEGDEDGEDGKRWPGKDKKGQEVHSSEVFLLGFTKQLYNDAVNKFLNSCSIHIVFAYFYFKSLKNIHAAIHELKIAEKKRPNLY